MSIFSRQFDRRAALAGVPETLGSIVAETVPRWGVQGGAAPSANKVYLTRIRLQARPYTTFTVLCTTAATGIANAFLAIIDPVTLARLALSADQSSAYNASVINTHIDLALSYTPPAPGDYYVALCFGTPSTIQLGRGMIGSTDLGGLAPILADRHNATVASGAIPDPVVLEGGVTGKAQFYVRAA